MKLIITTEILLGISSVEELTIFMSDDNLSITWSPPSFYSIDIPQGIIATYHVIVKNKDGSIIVNINTTDTFYNNEFSNNLTVCDIYTVIVTAFTEQYTSNDVSSTREYSGSMLTNIIPNTTIALYYRLYS